MPAPQLFTLDHFERYVSNLILDTGDYWPLEAFQGEVVEPILYFIRNQMVGECWNVLPEGNAKTTLMGGLALYCCDYAFLPWIPVAAASVDQANIMFNQARGMIDHSPGLQQRFRVKAGYRQILPIRRDHPGPGENGIKVYAADVETADGVIPWPLCLVDEAHRHKNMGIYTLWKGKCKKRHASIGLVSTAGEPGHEFEVMRDEIRDAAEERTRRPGYLKSAKKRIIMQEWRVEKKEDITVIDRVMEANPLSSLSRQDFEEALESPTLDLGLWSRVVCNIPARSSSAAVSEVEWDHAEVRFGIPLRAHVSLGIDVAWKHDTFAIVPCWNNVAGGYRLLGEPQILHPPPDGGMIHPDEVKVAIEHFQDLYQVDDATIDLERAEDVAAWIEDEARIKLIEWPQGNKQAAVDYEEFMRGLRDGMPPRTEEDKQRKRGPAIKHTGSSVLRAHVMHAVARRLPGDKHCFDRQMQGRTKKNVKEEVIDALVAASNVVCHLANPPGNALVGSVSDYRLVQL